MEVSGNGVNQGVQVTSNVGVTGGLEPVESTILSEAVPDAVQGEFGHATTKEPPDAPTVTVVLAGATAAVGTEVITVPTIGLVEDTV